VTNSRADVIVAGLGAWGGAVAHSLAARGYRVIGLDQFHPPHSAGSSHGRTRAFREATPEAEGLLDLTRRAGELWDGLAAHADGPLLERVGSLYVGPPEAWRIKDTIATLESGNLPYELFEANEARRRYPMFGIGDDEVVVLEPRAGVLFVEETIRAQLKAAAGRGADLHFNERLVSWSVEGDGVHVTSTQGSFEADFLVLTLGAWASTLIDLDLPIHVERQVAAWLAEIPDTAMRGNFPTFAFPCSGPHELLYGFPALRGDGIKLALHHGGATGELADLEPEVEQADLEALRAAIRERIPVLAETPFATSQTCRYVNTPDRLYALGPHPDHSQVLIATGESGRGFKFTPMIGEMMAELISGTTPQGFELFDLSRFAARDDLVSSEP
jgi:sarcosine oxidase